MDFTLEKPHMVPLRIEPFG